MRLLYLIGLLMFSIGPAFADETYDRCMKDSNSTNVAWQQCGVDWIEREEAALNAQWREMFALATNRTKAQLLAEQRAWVVFKDKSCEFYGNGEHGRDGLVLLFPACRAQVLAQRTKELSIFKSFLK